MCVRTSNALTRLKYVTSKTIVETSRMKFLVAQIVHLRVIAIRVGDSLQDLTTLTGGGKKERHQVWEQDPLLITPWEHRRYMMHADKSLYFIESRHLPCLLPYNH